MAIGVVGDLHFREKFSYGDYIADGRRSEWGAVLDTIINATKECDSIVLIGDQLNGRNNPSDVVREFVSFLERFQGKQLYIIAGNHEKFGNGKSGLDFLKELKDKPNWHVITDSIESSVVGNNKCVFLPYLTKAELGVKTFDEATARIMEGIGSANIIFAHHTISNTLTNHGQSTNDFSEVVLQQEELEKRFNLVVAGHIHKPQQYGRVVITGSSFTSEAGESDKMVWVINDDLTVTSSKLPVRHIVKTENPSVKSLEKLPRSSIVKAVFTQKLDDAEFSAVVSKLREFDCHIIVEQYPKERKRVHYEEGMLEFSVEQLLTEYAKNRGIKPGLLESAFDLIK